MKTSIISIITVLISVACAAADQLYTLNVAGTLLTVDQESGATTPVIEGLAAGSWNGLSAQPQLDHVLFALHNPRPPTFDDPRFSRLSRIDLVTGESTLFPFFASEQLGVDEVFSSGLAISPLAPDLGIVTGNDFGIPPQPYIWSVSLETGEVVDAARPLTGIRRIEALTFDAMGTLYGTNQDGELVTIDQDMAEASVVGSAGLTSFLTGISFRDGDDTLFAINAQREDELVTLDGETGSFIATVGDLGIGGPEGLAFLPEPSSLDCDLSGATDADDLHCANDADITLELLDELGLVLGDVDGQDGVTIADFLVLANHYQQPSGKYTDGDIDDSGFVDFADFLVLAANFGKGGSEVSAVPESSLSTCTAFVFLAILLLRRPVPVRPADPGANLR